MEDKYTVIDEVNEYIVTYNKKDNLFYSKLVNHGNIDKYSPKEMLIRIAETSVYVGNSRVEQHKKFAEKICKIIGENIKEECSEEIKLFEESFYWYSHNTWRHYYYTYRGRTREKIFRYISTGHVLKKLVCDDIIQDTRSITDTYSKQVEYIKGREFREVKENIDKILGDDMETKKDEFNTFANTDLVMNKKIENSLEKGLDEDSYKDELKTLLDSCIKSETAIIDEITLFRDETTDEILDKMSECIEDNDKFKEYYKMTQQNNMYYVDKVTHHKENLRIYKAVKELLEGVE